MSIQNYKNISQADLDKTVWRYLTFPKYISLLTYGALWFSKLNILTDKYEGSMPRMADMEMFAEHQKLKEMFDPAMHEQIDAMNTRNVESGRELTIVNCWFASEVESERMWTEYSRGSEGVAVKSTIRLLSQYVYCDPQFTTIGTVKYVDLSGHIMSHYEANQAQERAFLKGLDFRHEQEVRIATLNVKGSMCINFDGEALKPEEYRGGKMNNFDQPGLYIQADLQSLITTTVIAPGASQWFEQLVRRTAKLSKVGNSVERSKLENHSVC
jgi:hypothetical protein